MNRIPSRKAALIGTLSGLALVALTGGAAAAYVTHYEDVALPNVSVAGTSVSGMSRDEVTALVTSRVEDAALTVTVDGQSRDVPLADLGVTVDVPATVDAVFARNSTVGSRLAALFVGNEVPAVSAVDDKVLDSEAAELALLAGPAVVESSVVLDEDGDAWVAKEGSSGKAVDEEALRDAATTLGSGLVPASVDLAVRDVEPQITMDEAEAAASAANGLVAPEVSVTDGIDDFPADLATRVQWVDFPRTEDGSDFDAPVISRDKVHEWVNATAVETNVAPTPGIKNVDAQGKVLVEALPGKKGLEVNNVDAVTDELVASLASGSAFEGDFDYSDIEPTYEMRQALPGAENALYPAAAGERWMEIDLTNYTITAYEGLDVVHGPVNMVPGAPGHETVTGLFHVYLKYTKQDMGCTPEWPYCAKDVPWVSYFHQSYAFHGAPWVSHFGRGSSGGSHGCINLPVGEAKWVYDFTELGTPVVSHY